MKKYFVSFLPLVVIILVSVSTQQPLNESVDNNAKHGIRLKLPESKCSMNCQIDKGPVAKSRYPFRQNKKRAFLV